MTEPERCPGVVNDAWHRWTPLAVLGDLAVELVPVAEVCPSCRSIRVVPYRQQDQPPSNSG